MSQFEKSSSSETPHDQYYINSLSKEQLDILNNTVAILDNQQEAFQLCEAYKYNVDAIHRAINDILHQRELTKSNFNEWNVVKTKKQEKLEKEREREKNLEREKRMKNKIKKNKNFKNPKTHTNSNKIVKNTTKTSIITESSSTLLDLNLHHNIQHEVDVDMPNPPIKREFNSTLVTPTLLNTNLSNSNRNIPIHFNDISNDDNIVINSNIAHPTNINNISNSNSNQKFVPISLDVLLNPTSQTTSSNILPSNISTNITNNNKEDSDIIISRNNLNNTNSLPEPQSISTTLSMNTNSSDRHQIWKVRSPPATSQFHPQPKSIRNLQGDNLKDVNELNLAKAAIDAANSSKSVIPPVTFGKEEQKPLNNNTFHLTSMNPVPMQLPIPVQVPPAMDSHPVTPSHNLINPVYTHYNPNNIVVGSTNNVNMEYVNYNTQPYHQPSNYSHQSFHWGAVNTSM